MTSLAIDRPGTVALVEDADGTSLDADSRWFSQLYEETAASAYRYALIHTHNPTLAEDVVAEAFLRAWRARRSFAGRSGATSWMLSITRNCAVDALRKRKVEQDVATIPEPSDPLSASETPALDDYDIARIHKAIQQLTPEQQQVIVLRFFEELPHDAVAKRLGRSPVAVRAVQFRALARLRKLLGVAP